MVTLTTKALRCEKGKRVERDNTVKRIKTRIKSANFHFIIRIYV